MLRSLWASRAPLASWLPRRPLTAGLSASAVSTTATTPFHVKIKSRRRWRNAAIGAGVMYACWSAYFTRVVLPPIADMIDEEDAAPIFFPLPFTFQIVEAPPYKGTDPEWQAYIRIAKDRDLLMKIRNDMLETVRAAAEANPILRHRCGRAMTVRKHWLDLDFPYRPPPKITRDGFLLTAEGLDYVTAEVDAVTMMRISRALWPEPVALSATSFVTTLCRQNMQNVARFFGFGGEDPKRPAGTRPPPPTPADLAALAERLKKEAEGLKKDVDELKSKDPRLRPSGSDKGKGAAGDESAADAAGAEGVQTTPSPSPSSSRLYPPPRYPVTPTLPARPKPPSKSTSNWEDLSGILNAKDLIPFYPVRSSIDAAWRDFRKKLAETWLPLRPQPPGGSVGVSGLVELQSPNSRVMIEVTAFWDPKTRKYDAPTMHMKLRSIRPRNQMPL